MTAVQSIHITPAPAPSNDWRHFAVADWFAFTLAAWTTFTLDLTRAMLIAGQSIAITPPAAPAPARLRVQQQSVHTTSGGQP